MNALKKYSTYAQWTSMLLAVVFLTSTSGISLNVHFCKGKAKAIAFFTPAKACFEDTDAEKTSCRADKKCDTKEGLSRAECCSDHTFYLKLSSEFSPDYASLQTSQLCFCQSPFFPTEVTPALCDNKESYNINDPPFIDKNIVVSHQVFLI